MLGVTASIVKSSEKSNIIEFNVEQSRRLEEFEERMTSRDRNDYASVYRTSKWKPKLQLPKSSYGSPKSGPIYNQESQRSLRKIDTREVITSIFVTSFLHLVLFLKQWVVDMYYGLNQIYFFR